MGPTTTADRDVARLAARQHGLITAKQATTLGIGAGQIRHRLRMGRWRPAREGVFEIAGVPPSWEQALMAAVLATGEDAVASHGSAARLWRLDCPHDDQLEVTSPRTRRVRIPGVRAHRSVVFLGEEHGRTRGIAATSVARTIVDLSGRLSTRELGVVLDDGLRRNIVTLDVLRRCVAGLAPAPGRRPSRVHRLLVDRLPGYDPGESELEMRVVRTLVAGGVPQPVLQHEVAVADRSYRLDLAYPGSRLAIEVDGWEFHRSRAAFDRDRTRANALVVAGWTLLRFTSRMSPEEMVVSVKTALAALGHERTS